MGPGFLESVYEGALAIELNLRNVPFERQSKIALQYKGQAVGEGRLDFLVGGCLVVELKAVDLLNPIHCAQVISDLKVLKVPLGLLINFNEPILKTGIKRSVYSPPDLGVLGALAV